MCAVVYHGPGKKAWEEVADPVIIDDTDAIVRVDAVDDLRHRPAHPQGRRPRGDRRPHPRPRGGRHRRGGRRRRQERQGRRPGAGLVHHRVRRLPVLPRGHATASASAAAAGSSATRSTAPRPSTSGCRSPTRRPTRCPAGVSDEAAADAGRHPAHRLRGRRAQRPGPARRRRRRRRRRPDRPGRDHGRPAVQPEPHRRHRPGRQPARGGQAVRRRRHRQQRPRGRRSRSSAS